MRAVEIAGVTEVVAGTRVLRAETRCVVEIRQIAGTIVVDRATVVQADLVHSAVIHIRDERTWKKNVRYPCINKLRIKIYRKRSNFHVTDIPQSEIYSYFEKA